MRAGLLNKRIQILSKSFVKDDFGSVKETYSALYSVRARVKFNTGTNTIDNFEITPLYSVDFTIRYRDGINENMIITFDNKRYKINNIIPADNRDSITLNTQQINE